jgi:uncharacterized RDD family membrane protein YckC
MQWYYAIDGQRCGPVTHLELERLVRAGTIVGDTLLWRQGMNEWQTLAAVRAVNPAWIAEPPGTQEKVSAGEVAAAAEAPVAGGEPAAAPTGDAGVGVSASATPAEVALNYAGFGRRAGAHLVDFFLWWLIWQVLVELVGRKYFPEAMVMAQQGPGYQPKPDELMMLLRFLGVSFFIGMVWAVVYDALFVLRFGATPGKLMLGLRVVGGDGRPLGLMRITARCLAKGLVGFTLGIGYLIVAIDDQKRGLHDFFCKTRVVQTRPGRRSRLNPPT